MNNNNILVLSIQLIKNWTSKFLEFNLILKIYKYFIEIRQKLYI